MLPKPFKDFYIEQRVGHNVIIESGGGICSATDREAMMYNLVIDMWDALIECRELIEVAQEILDIKLDEDEALKNKIDSILSRVGVEEMGK